MVPAGGFVADMAEQRGDDGNAGETLLDRLVFRQICRFLARRGFSAWK
jgi:hypothetical protein